MVNFLIVLGLIFMPLLIFVRFIYLTRKVTFLDLIVVGLSMFAYTGAISIVKTMLQDEGDTIGKDLGDILVFLIEGNYCVLLNLLLCLGSVFRFFKQNKEYPNKK